MMMNIQNILRILTTGRRLVKSGICVMNLSRTCPGVRAAVAGDTSPVNSSYLSVAYRKGYS